MAKLFDPETWRRLFPWRRVPLEEEADEPDGPEVRDAPVFSTVRRPRPDGPLVWIHTGADASGAVAESFAERLLGALDNVAILRTADRISAATAAGRILRQPAPPGQRQAVRKFLDHWLPDCVIWTEPAIGVHYAREIARRGIPAFLADAETRGPASSDRRKYRGGGPAPFRKVLTSRVETVDFGRRIGVADEDIEQLGPLREGKPPPGCNLAERDDLATYLRARPVWLAVETDEAEFELVLDAHVHALRQSHRMLLILSVRDCAKARVAHDLARERGLLVALRSEGAEPDPEVSVYVADQEGELGLWYRLSAVAYLGGLAEGVEATDPNAAARLGSAILYGRHTGGFGADFDLLLKAGAAVQVGSPTALGPALETLLAPDRAAELAHAAWQVTSRGAATTDRLIELVAEALDEPASAEAEHR